MDDLKRQKSTTFSGRPPERGFENNAGAPASLDPNTGKYRDYWVLSPAERTDGFVRPYRDTYAHAKCGTETMMGRAIAETYAKDPKYYGYTYCCACRTHFPVAEFCWAGTAELVGS